MSDAPGGLVLATEERYTLAEGPVWDAAAGVVRWVDVEEGLVLEGDLGADGRITVLGSESFGETVGAVLPAAAGGRVVAGGDGLHIRRADGVVEPGPRILAAGSGRRLNDAATDPAGRLLVGTLALDGASTTEQLVIVRDDGLETIDHDLTLSNGLGWSPDGRTLYSVDSHRRVVFHRPWDPEVGTWGDRTTLLAFEEGHPDGLTVDAGGNMWIAMWGLGEVRRYDPGGALLTTIAVPVPHTSSVAFAGPGLDVLVITTARRDLTAEERGRYPAAGALFTIRPGVRGLPQAPWAGTA